MVDEDYVTVDFRPAPQGWMVAYLSPEDWCRFVAVATAEATCAACGRPKDDDRHLRLSYADLPGWLIQEAQRTKHRRIVAAEVTENGEIHEIVAMGQWNTSAWRVLGPGRAVPTVEEVIEARDERARQRAAFFAPRSLKVA